MTKEEFAYWGLKLRNYLEQMDKISEVMGVEMTESIFADLLQDAGRLLSKTVSSNELSPREIYEDIEDAIWSLKRHFESKEQWEEFYEKYDLK